MQPEEPAPAQPLMSQVVMLCQGDENYGVGTVLKIYAQVLPWVSFVALGHGRLVDWSKSHGKRVDVVPGLAKFWEGGPSLWTLARAPGVLVAARRDAAKIDALLRPRGIRIVHAHWRPQQIMAGFLRRRGYRSVWHIHNNSNRQRLFGASIKLNHMLARWGADLLLPVSDFIAGNWSGCGVPTSTVRNAAEPMFRTSNQLPERPIRCIIAGRLVHSKGHHLAVEAVIRARQSGLDVHLDVYGEPLAGNTYAAELQRKVVHEGCADAIRFLGFQSELRQRHQQYHLGLQCRIDPEPCSVWVCETLVDGLPLVASDSGGTPELVEDGVTGLLFRSGDVDGLSERLLRLASNPELLRNMRSAAFERGQRLFTLERFAQETLRAYATLGFDGSRAK